jgi:hypothetical protein
MAREVYDIRLNEDLSLSIAAGDFQVVESTERHQQLLLLYEPGELRVDLLAGVGIGGYILSDTDEVVVEKEIEREFRLDGMTVRRLDVRSLEDVRIDAFYK